MPRHRLLCLVVLALAALATVGEVYAQAAWPFAQVTRSSRFAPVDGQDSTATLPNRLAGEVGILEHLGARVTRETTFLNEDGRPVQLGEFMTGNRPVVLAFVYHSCPMLCSLTLDGFADALRETDLGLGTDFEALAISFDPRDTPERAAEAKARFIARVGKPEADAGWHFLTSANTEPIGRLADEVGFDFAYDPATQEYAHPAVLVFLSPQGVVTRYLYGVNHTPRDFRLATVEAGQGTIGTTLDRFVLTCFQFDPHARTYSLAILNVAKIGGGLLFFLFAGTLVMLWRREGKGRDAVWKATADSTT